MALTQVMLREEAGSAEVVGFIDRTGVRAVGDDGRRWRVVKVYASVRADLMRPAAVLRFRAIGEDQE